MARQAYEVDTDGMRLEPIQYDNSWQLGRLSQQIVSLMRRPDAKWMSQERPSTRRLFGSLDSTEQNLRDLSVRSYDRDLNFYTIRSGRSGQALAGFAKIIFNKSVALNETNEVLSGHSLDYVILSPSGESPEIADLLINESHQLALGNRQSMPVNAQVNLEKDVMMVTVPVESNHPPVSLMDDRAGFSLRGIARVAGSGARFDDAYGKQSQVYTTAFARE